LKATCNGNGVARRHATVNNIELKQLFKQHHKQVSTDELSYWQVSFCNESSVAKTVHDQLTYEFIHTGTQSPVVYYEKHQFSADNPRSKK
jgi:hypothetical protein